MGWDNDAYGLTAAAVSKPVLKMPAEADMNCLEKSTKHPKPDQKSAFVRASLPSYAEKGMLV